MVLLPHRQAAREAEQRKKEKLQEQEKARAEEEARAEREADATSATDVTAATEARAGRKADAFPGADGACGGGWLGRDESVEGREGAEKDRVMKEMAALTKAMNDSNNGLAQVSLSL